LEPQQLQATFDSGLAKKIQQKYSQLYSVPLMIYFARQIFKDKKRVSEFPPLPNGQASNLWIVGSILDIGTSSVVINLEIVLEENSFTLRINRTV